MKFLDEAKIFIKSGNGGPGSVAFRREKFIEFGGPDGGDGGRGGDVIVEAVAALNTLIDFRYLQHIKAESGEPGAGANRTGHDGKDAIIRVPIGTEILEDDKETVVCDLTQAGERIVLAEGGQGGYGNAYYKTSTNRAPRRADPGWPGKERWLWLRLKLIADGGVVGLPNAGKSTFLSRVSAARPKIAEYPFTTLHPNLGVVVVDEKTFVLADLPGLIENAHQGAGLGVRFLGHVERCRVLVHLVDGTETAVVAAWRTVRAELKAYGHGLAKKPEILVLSKCDALTPDVIARKKKALAKAAGRPVIALSAVSGLGLTDVLRAIAKRLTRPEPIRRASLVLEKKR